MTGLWETNPSLLAKARAIARILCKEGLEKLTLPEDLSFVVSTRPDDTASWTDHFEMNGQTFFLGIIKKETRAPHL